MRRESRETNEREFRRSCELLRGAMDKEENRAAFDAMDDDLKRAVVEEAFKDGILKYTVLPPGELPSLPCGKSIYGGTCLRENFHDGDCVPDYISHKRS